MIVDVWMNPALGHENKVSIWLRKEFVAPEMPIPTYVAAPSVISFNLDEWNGEHLSFDADTFAYEPESAMVITEGVVDSELAEIWLNQFGRWEQMKPFRSMKHESVMAIVLLRPMQRLLGLPMHSQETLDEFVEAFA